MNRLIILATLFLFMGWGQNNTLSSQTITGTKEITLEEIWGGAFRTNYMNSLNSMKNEDYYTLLGRSKEGYSVVDKYSYKTLEKVATSVEANKDFDLLIYPDRTHGIYKGRNTRLHLYKKMTAFIQESLNMNKDKMIKIKG